MSDTSKRLLTAARDLFLSQGFAGTTIQQLADAAGISKGAVYLHFRSKNDVLVGLFHEIGNSALEQAQQIAQRDDLTARQKLRAALHFQFADVREQHQLFEIYVQESGLAMDEDLALMAQKMRVDWQHLQEDFLRAAFSDLDERFVTDLAVSLNGALNEYYTYVLLEGVQVDADRVADFLVALAQGMVEYLAGHDLAPVLEPGDLPEAGEIDQKMQLAAARRIEAALVEIETHAASIDDEQASEIRETVSALRTTLAADEPSRVVLQGLLANLRDVRELQAQRKALAHELNLRLV
jgi:AcrR family transcriptional regulator